jgi:hypothetical protein
LRNGKQLSPISVEPESQLFWETNIMTTATHIPSSVNDQYQGESRPGADFPHFAPIEIRQSSELATRVHVHEPSVMALYVSLARPALFNNYYEDELRPYLRSREEEMDEKRGGHGGPVSMLRKGRALMLAAAQSCPFVPWSNLTPQLREFFESMEDVDRKLYCGDWPVNGPEPLGEAFGSTPDFDGAEPPAANYSMIRRLNGNTDITFYQIKTGRTEALDRSFEHAVNNWPGAPRKQEMSLFAAARIADILCVITGSQDSKILDCEVESALSRHLNPAMTQLIHYPRKTGY